MASDYIVDFSKLGEGYGFVLTSPGRDNGKYIAEYKARIYHPLSSGGQPRWDAYAPTPREAFEAACEKMKKDGYADWDKALGDFDGDAQLGDEL